MYDIEPSPAHLIGLTGSFGSGCTFVAENILASLGYKRFSLSEALRQEYQDRGGNLEAKTPRSELQFLGDEVRQAQGAAFFADRVAREIVIHHASASQQKYVVDSIRNPEEVHFLRRSFPNFFLIGIYASHERRWGRVKNVYDGDRKQFEVDDERDTGRRSSKDGQRVEDCFSEADVVLANDSDFTTRGNVPFQGFSGKVKSYIDLISSPLSRRQPSQSESLMAAAYTISQRSSCLQRKVGAIITDDEGNIISSGFNEVPRAERPCSDEYGKCRRKWEWEQFRTLLSGNSAESEKLLALVREQFRMLDRCRALHAEENAILNLARNGRSVPLEVCTLYTTTYPCSLCANKIANLGIKHIVYCEPYPDPAARVILDSNGIEDEFFEGVTFKSYARIYGEKK